MKKIILNNKSNLSYKEVEKIKKELEKNKSNNVDLIYFPSVQYLSSFNGSKLNIGTQNFFSYNYGPYTGEINLESLKDMNISYTLIGHSDRKILHLDTYPMIKEKLFKSINAHFNTILCLGSQEKNINNFRFIKKELKYLLRSLKAKDLEYLTIAYEPVDAIGSGRAEDINKTKKIVASIKKYMLDKYSIDTEVYYGGSVDEKNVNDYLDFCDGVLIGKNSNSLNDIKKIIKIVDIDN